MNSVHLRDTIFLSEHLEPHCFLREQWGSRCVCVCVCVSTSPGVCALGWVKCREQNFTAGYTLYNYVCKKKKKKKILNRYFFFTKPIMVKCLNIGKNIGKPIYRSISSY